MWYCSLLPCGSSIVTIPVKFQQKTNLALIDRIDPQIALPFSSCTRYEKWYLYCIVSDFCAVNIFKYGKIIIISNKSKNQ